MWKGKEICLHNPDCLDQAVLESGDVQYLIEEADE